MRNILLILPLFLLFSCENAKKNKEITTQLMDTLAAGLNNPELVKANEMLKKDPGNADLYLKRGQIYFDLKNFPAAAEDAKRALRIDSFKDASYLLLTDACFSANQTRQSKETLLRWIKNMPKSPDGYLKLAELYFYVKKYQESINYINEALKIDENLAKGYFLKGMCFKETGDTVPAISSFQTACEQNGQYYDAFVETGRLMAIKKNPLCIGYFTGALRIDPKSTEVMYMAAKFYQDQGKIKQAVDAYNKLLEFDNKHKNTLYNLGSIEFNSTKDYNKAKEYFSRAIESDPQYAEAYFARGVCFEKLKDENNAIADYKMALQYRPNYDFAIENLNRLLDRKKGK